MKERFALLAGPIAHTRGRGPECLTIAQRFPLLQFFSQCDDHRA
jgi:hypothetical protein